MKRGRLPLTALRSFESAGRHLSFSRAAEELFVSQAAISRQIRDLEAAVGRPLFERLHRRVELTLVGERLLAQLTRSFDAIDRELSEIVASPKQATVTISVEPSFGRAWLVPRLGAFRELRPDIDVAVEVDARLAEFRGQEIDLAVRYSLVRTDWPRVEAIHLVDVSVCPVMSPDLLAAGRSMRDLAELASHTLLHEDNRRTWSHWLKAAGGDEALAGRGPIFPDAALAAQAAVLAQGVALGDSLLSADDLEAGRLMCPFDLWVPYGGYFLVARDFARLKQPARAFADWLRAEISATRVAS